MYTATSIDVFITAYSGAIASYQKSRVPKSVTLGNFERISNAALAYAEEFDTVFAVALPNELQLQEISSISEQFIAYPNNDTFSRQPATYLKVVNSIIAMMSETSAVVAANVTNPIPVPTPVSQTVLQISTVVGAGLKGTVPITAVAAIVDGYTTAGDGGGGLFFWDTTSALTDDGGTIINPTGHVGNGRWIRIYTGALQVKWFGAYFDNAHDDTTAIQLCISALGNSTTQVRTGTIEFPDGGTARITGTLHIDRLFCTLNGPGPGSSQGNGCALRWDGVAAIPMMLVTQCNGLTIRGLRFIGKTAAPPSAAIELNAFGGNNPPLTDIVLENLWIGGMSGSDTAVTNGFTCGIITSGADLQVDQSVMRDITIQDVIDACIVIANPQNTVWQLDHIILNSAAIGIRCGSRWVRVNNIFCSTITTACYELILDGNLWIENFGHEGNARFVQGASTGAGFKATNGYYQSYLPRMPANDRIIDVTTAAFTLFLDNVQFSRNGVFTPGQEKIYVRSTDGVARISPDTHFTDFPGTSDSAHFDFDTINALNTFQVWWGEENYYNHWVHGAALKVGARWDVVTSILLASSVVALQGKTNLGTAMDCIKVSGDADNYTLIASNGKDAKLDTCNLIMASGKFYQGIDNGGVVRNMLGLRTSDGAVLLGSSAGGGIVAVNDVKGGAGLDISGFRNLFLNQAASGIEFSEVAHNTHSLKVNAVPVISMNDNAGVLGGLGFYGHAPAAKPTVAGVKVDPVAASILAALVALGLVIDTTT